MALVPSTLHTDRLTLRPFTDADTQAMFDLHSDAVILAFWDSPPWTEFAQARRFIKTCRTMEAEEHGVRLVIERTFDASFLGWCVVTNWNPVFRSAELGFMIHKHGWSQGYTTEAAISLVQWAFDALDLNRLQAVADTRNGASRRVLEKLGFQLEGTLRQDCIVNGDVSDSWVFGLLARDR